MKKEDLISDLTPFVDIGEPNPTASIRDGRVVAKIVRENRTIKIAMDPTTLKVQVTPESGQVRYFASPSQMFASELFANLRRWADAQRDYLKKNAVPEKDLIPTRGLTSNDQEVNSVGEVDSLVGRGRTSLDSVEVLLLNGPAGIGKSTLIEQLAVSRAESYRAAAKPLILHVKSRGRVLSNLQDLMAFSLQTLRLHITYDQIPVLVKHGLVVLAIDGFDELGDPSGYELAWSQVNDLVTSIRGHGSLILAGRDTFIGRQRLLRDVKALRDGVDAVTEIILDSPVPDQAKEWLKQKAQWTEASFRQPAISVLLESGSYALRPVFLRLLRDQIKPKEIKAKSETDLTTLLVNHMVSREATKFGDAVESAMTLPGIEAFVHAFLREVAREMADSQTESLDATALSWIAEAALGDGWSAQIQSLIKHRVNVIAFLCDDERAGHRRFSHIQIMNYFLSHVTLEALSAGEVPKFIRRNLLGKDFLISFGETMFERSGAGDQKVLQFLHEAGRFVRDYGHLDRAVRNLGALLLTSTPSFSAEEELTVGGFHVDETIIRRTVPKSVLRNMVINQLDIRGADLGEAEFVNVAIVRLIADDISKVSKTFPTPSTLQVDTGELLSEAPIAAWLDRRGRESAEDSEFGVSSALRAHEAYKLLGRVCRQKQYWLRSEGDFHAARILNNTWWPAVAEVLSANGFLREEIDRQASGRSSTFYHIKQADRLLSEDMTDPDVLGVYRSLAEKVALS